MHKVTLHEHTSPRVILGLMKVTALGTGKGMPLLKYAEADVWLDRHGGCIKAVMDLADLQLTSGNMVVSIAKLTNC